jgi:hypothetical protein
MNTQRTLSKAVTRRKFYLGVAITGAILTGITLTGCQRNAILKPETNVSGYAEDRALIEDLQSRYMFALDFGDLDKYLATFTEDGVLDIGEGECRGREAIRKLLESIPKSAPDTSKLPPPAGRHCIANIVLKIEGNKAFGRAYWFHMSNNNPQRSSVLDSYGHYEDEMIKVNGTWLFSKRRIYNEQYPRWVASRSNPCW